MINLAVTNPDIGVVGAYSLAGSRVRCDGLGPSQNVISGHEICRLTLMGKIYPFWSPSSTLLRSDLVRNRQPFYRPPGLHADVEAMYEILQHCDFGFVHQVLTYIREHEASETSKSAKPLNTMIAANLELIVHYSPVYLDTKEYEERLDQYLTRYYDFLARSFYEGRDAKFWQYHRNALHEAGHPLSMFRFYGKIVAEAISSPRATVRKVLKRMGLR